MHGRTKLLLVALTAGAAIVVSDVTYAQLSPQGIIGGITRPFRHAFGRIGHYPRARHHRSAARAASARAAAAEGRSAQAGPRDASSASGYRLGRVGPPAWPNAYEDVIGFTFWPDDYAARLRGHGFDLIADTIAGRFDLRRSWARTATVGAAIRNDSDTENSAGQCGDAPNTASNWPSSRIEQILQLSDAQRSALEKMQSAALQSARKVQADCGGLGTLSPPDRLRALVQTLWTVRDAGVLMREPLRNFSATLTDNQKSSFVSQPQKMPEPDSNTANEEMNKMYQACAAQNAERAERLIKEIEMRVRPDKDQAQSFENFHKVSSDMAKMLIASCAQPIPADPMARLDSANDQLTAINYAATTVQIAFDDFYLKLKNDQKTRFDSLAR
jgi:LTXXQ motif family protein